MHEGIRTTREIAADVLLASTLPRARQTAEIVELLIAGAAVTGWKLGDGAMALKPAQRDAS